MSLYRGNIYAAEIRLRKLVCNFNWNIIGNVKTVSRIPTPLRPMFFRGLGKRFFPDVAQYLWPLVFIIGLGKNSDIEQRLRANQSQHCHCLTKGGTIPGRKHVVTLLLSWIHDSSGPMVPRCIGGLMLVGYMATRGLNSIPGIEALGINRNRSREANGLGNR